MTEHSDRFERAVRMMDEANRQDPRTEIADGERQPREWLFARRVYDWVTKLSDEPSEALLLAARGHTLCRWLVPRDDYPRTTVGYHKWRDACAALHADQAEAIIREVGYGDDTIGRVRDFITKANWPADEEACVLEDADCLVFLETKLGDYIDEWDEEKMQRILQRTMSKMTPKARELAHTLQLGSRERALLTKAASA